MKRKKLTVAVIFGGRSGEHEVSLVSAQSVIKNLNKKKYEIIEIGIKKTGEWLTGKNALKAFKSGQTKHLRPAAISLNPHKPGIFVFRQKMPMFQAVDVAFPALHGPYGEDGTIQGLLEMAGIPYVGSGVFASAACMDKFMTKIIFKACGLLQPKFLKFTRQQIKKELPAILKIVASSIGYPCFVKPSNLGSSVGISKVKKPENLAAALLLASSYDSSILVEQAIDAREIECAVLGNERPIASSAGEIVPSREFYDYFAKYVDNSSRLIIPAKISQRKLEKVQRLAVEAYKITQCSGMARVDFLMDKKTGKIYISEINTIPGFTAISMYPKLWRASGIPYPKLLDRLVELAIALRREKSRNKISFENGNGWYRNQ